MSPVFGGRTHSPGGEGGEGSIFCKTRDIGLPSYSNNLSTVHTHTAHSAHCTGILCAEHSLIL
jgi:hypothetical protein